MACPGTYLVFFLGVREETALAVGRWAGAAAVDGATAEAPAAGAADVTVRRGTEATEAPEATPGTLSPLIFTPVLALVTVAPFWKIDSANASGPGPADTVLREPKALKATLGRLGPMDPTVLTTLSLPRRFAAMLK